MVLATRMHMINASADHHSLLTWPDLIKEFFTVNINEAIGTGRWQ
jgi:hypothetical protein